MSASLVIRRATLADAAAVRAIYAPYVEQTCISFEEVPPDEAEMALRIAAALEHHDFLVAETSGQLAGYAYASPHRTRAAYCTSVDVAVYLRESAQGCGLGRALYGELLPRLARRGYHAAFAGIALPNPASVALHEATGFTRLGVYREVGRKFGKWLDVGWWQRLL